MGEVNTRYARRPAADRLVCRLELAIRGGNGSLAHKTTQDVVDRHLRVSARKPTVSADMVRRLTKLFIVVRRQRRHRNP